MESQQSCEVVGIAQPGNNILPTMASAGGADNNQQWKRDLKEVIQKRFDEYVEETNGSNDRRELFRAGTREGRELSALYPDKQKRVQDVLKGMRLEYKCLCFGIERIRRIAAAAQSVQCFPMTMTADTQRQERDHIKAIVKAAIIEANSASILESGLEILPKVGQQVGRELLRQHPDNVELLGDVLTTFVDELSLVQDSSIRMSILADGALNGCSIEGKLSKKADGIVSAARR